MNHPWPVNKHSPSPRPFALQRIHNSICPTVFTIIEAWKRRYRAIPLKRYLSCNGCGWKWIRWSDFKSCLYIYIYIYVCVCVCVCAGHCWRSRDELISDVLLWTPTYGWAKTGRPARRQLHNNVASNIEQVLAAIPHKAPTIRPPASHQEKYTS